MHSVPSLLTSDLVSLAADEIIQDSRVNGASIPPHNALGRWFPQPFRFVRARVSFITFPPECHPRFVNAFLQRPTSITRLTFSPSSLSLGEELTLRRLDLGPVSEKKRHRFVVAHTPGVAWLSMHPERNKKMEMIARTL